MPHLATAETDLVALRRDFEELESGYRAVCDELAELSERSDQLVLHHAAARAIAGAPGQAALLQVLQEVVVNAIGSEELAIFDLADGQPRLARAFGVARATLGAAALDQGPVGRVVASGQGWVVGRDAPAPGTEGLTACVPLRADGRVVGALAIWRLLGHKPALVPTDLDLLDLITVHAGQALLLHQLLERGG
jgi:GAF domain-containing protein